jgi:nucleotide-binding universal stress UspA family protein
VVVLEHAFGRARELNVPLEVVHACEIPPLLSWSPNDIAESQQRASAALALCLAPWRARYPDVEVSTQVVAERPSDALREAPSAAQLIVLGRHKSATRHGGFHAQSTARQPLHRLTVPVLVLPTPMTGQNHLAHERLDTWAPIY